MVWVGIAESHGERNLAFEALLPPPANAQQPRKETNTNPKRERGRTLQITANSGIFEALALAYASG